LDICEPRCDRHWRIPGLHLIPQPPFV